MTDAAALASLRKAKVFLDVFVREFDVDPDKTSVGVRAVLPSEQGRTVAEVNLGDLLREAATLIAEADAAAAPPPNHEARPS